MAQGLKRVNKGIQTPKTGLSTPKSGLSNLQAKRRAVTPTIGGTSSSAYSAMTPQQRIKVLQAREQREKLLIERAGQVDKSQEDDRNWFEKALNLQKGQNFVFDLFEILDRPGQVIKGLFDPGEDDVLNSMWKGLSGQKRISGVEFAKDVFGIETDDTVGKFLIGLGTDIATDPLTFWDAPLRLAGKGIKMGAKAGAGITRKGISVFAGGEKLLSKFDDISLSVKNTVKDAFGLHKTKAYNKLRQEQSAVRGSVNVSRERALETLRGVNKQIDDDVAKLAKGRIDDSDRILKSMGLKQGASVDDIKKAYSQEVMQHLERGSTSLSQKDILENLAQRRLDDGRGIFAFPNIKGKNFKELENTVKPMKKRLSEILGRELSADDFKLVMSDTGSGAFLTTSNELTGKIGNYLSKSEIINQRLATFGLNNQELGALSSLAGTGKVTLSLSNPIEREIFNKVNTMLKGRLKIINHGADIREIGLTRRQLAQFLDGKEAEDLARHLQEKYLSKTDLPGEPAIQNTRISPDQKTTIEEMVYGGMRTSDMKVDAVGVSKSVQTNAKYLTKSYDDMLKLGDNDFFKLKSSRVSNTILKNNELVFNDIVRNLEGVKNRVYETANLLGNSKIEQVAKNLNMDGYMRHIANPETIMWNRLKSLDPADPKALQLIKDFTRGAKKDTTLFTRKWQGSAKDINKTFGKSIFNANPIESIAVSLKILPDRFLATNLIDNALDSTLIREFSTSEIKTIQSTLKEGEFIHDAVSRSVPKEFRMLNQESVSKLKDSFSFLKHGGAKGEEMQALGKSLDNILDKKGGIIHRGLYNQIIDYGRRLNEAGVNEVLNIVNKYFMQPWKRIALFSTGYHMRNFGSNMMNGYLAGMHPNTYIKHFGGATRDLTTIERQILPKVRKMALSGRKELSSAKGQIKLLSEVLDPKELKLYNEMMEWSSKGVIGSNKFANDHFQVLSDIQGMAKKKGIIRKTAKKVNDASMKFGKLSDDASRIAAYRWGHTTKGAKHIKKIGLESPEGFSRYAFFDFNDITPFEQKYMRAVFPFYTWARKNFEFHVRNIAKQPKRYVRLNKFLSNWQGSFIEDEDELGRWSKAQMLMPVMSSGNKITMMKLSPTFMDMSEVMGPDILSRLNPIIKLPFEALTGKNFFSKRDIDSNLFGQFGLEMFGSMDNLKKLMRGDYENVNKSELGLVGQRLWGAEKSLTNIFKGSAQSVSDIIPSFFRDEDVGVNKERAITERVRLLEQYIRDLKRRGVPVETPSQAFGAGKVRRSSGKIPNFLGGKRRY